MGSPRSFEAHARESLDCCELNVGRNADGKGHSCEAADKNEEWVFRNYREGDSCYKVANNLAKLCSSVL